MKKLKLKKKALFIIILLPLLLVLLLFTSIYFYFTSPVDKKDDTIKQIIIEEGTSTSQIAEKLKASKIIKNERVFRQFLKLKKADNIYAASYYFKSSMTLNEVIDVLKQGGHNLNEIAITFREGINVLSLANIIEENTSNTKEDVFNTLKDEGYIDSLIDKYWFLTDDIKNKDIYYPLEGYLFPNTYFFASYDVDVKDIFDAMLDEMDKVLTKYKSDIEKNNLSIHKLLTLASIIELEGIDKSSRKDIASVFYNRLNSNMSLGSDVTTYYAFKVDINERDLYQYEIDSDNPYNTRNRKMNGKLPVGPISLPSKESIEAAIYPSKTNYYYFVADKNNKVYFTKTFEEHEKTISKLQDEGLWLEW